jgi:hypothetical protein
MALANEMVETVEIYCKTPYEANRVTRQVYAEVAQTVAQQFILGKNESTLTR